jgi:hypothetical protein
VLEIGRGRNLNQIVWQFERTEDGSRKYWADIAAEGSTPGGGERRGSKSGGINGGCGSDPRK